MMKDISMMEETRCMTRPLTLVKCHFSAGIHLCHLMKLIHLITGRLLSKRAAHFLLST